MTTMQAVPAANSAFSARDVGDETIIISEKGDMLHTLNAVGSSIWRNVNGKRSIQELLEIVLEKYDTSEPAARADILRFFEELEKKNIITWVLHS